MQKFLTDKNTDAYSNRWLKKKLKDHFNDSIYISEVEGCPDLVTLREKTSEILRSHFKSTQRDLDEESLLKQQLDSLKVILYQMFYQKLTYTQVLNHYH